jgi:hypothetical protein
MHTEGLVTRTLQRDKTIAVQFMFRFDPIQSSKPYAYIEVQRAYVQITLHISTMKVS